MAEADSLAEVRRWAANALAEAGIEDPVRESSLLIAAALGITQSLLLLPPETRLAASDRERIAAFVERRVKREPLSRIRGSREFYGRTFHLSEATLDPRPETETVIEASLILVAEGGLGGRPLRILDIGTGSGAILLTLIAEFPLATGLGTDIAPEALATAEANARRLGLADRVSFLRARSLEGVTGPFDLLVSNPPYIPAADIAALDPEVRDFDPRAALDGGPDGLAVYREIAAGLSAAVPRGLAVLEVGHDQAAAVSRIFTEVAGPQLGPLRTWRDLGGHVRCVAMQTQF